MRIAFRITMNERLIDRKTAAFYFALVGLVILDLMSMVWILNPFVNLGTPAFALRRNSAVNDSPKPSPFELAEAKQQQPVQPLRRRARNVAVNPVSSQRQ